LGIELSLLLFDIDGTLLLSGGAGLRAMSIAFHETFGIARAFDGVQPAGKTDTFLLASALERAGIDDSPTHHDRFRAAYLSALATELARPGTGRSGVMPGVETLLARLHAQDGWHIALLTGNYERAARLKLQHFGLDGFFDWGVFGDESGDRRVLGRIALERARAREVPEPSCVGAVVIGDTPDDIACAHAAGARSLAVATGSYTVDELTAAGAHHAVADLSDTDAVLAMLEAVRR
jgi:phosphoglycolate phosphatase